MRVLVVHYSRNGHTARLAAALADEARTRGHTVETEAIRVKQDWNKWLLAVPLLPLLPLLPLYLASARFRALWHRIHFQPQQAIERPAICDVSRFDLVLLGTPKWLYISYPVARWLNVVDGLAGTRVATFATFCGPPLRVFEIDMLFEPLDAAIRARGGEPGPRLAVSSDYHSYFFFNEMRSVFRWLSKRVFGRPLSDFTLDGVAGQGVFEAYCDKVMG